MFDKVIGVIGLGYVGLPLAVEFGKKIKVVGFDLNRKRLAELKKGQDLTLETTSDDLASSTHLSFSSNPNDLKICSIFIIAVPTPIDKDKKPDLDSLINSTETVGNILKKGDLVIYESTVYPGATEEVCVPILEKESKLIFNQDFFCGYSPERINPGDKQRGLVNIKKVTSGSTPEIAELVDNLYNKIIVAGTYKAESIRIAEASKVIENTQRDVNIALMNEFSLIFNTLGIDTESVLKAAGSKWNFLPFQPGLVGGHCIHVDPYYLAHKSIEAGYHPEIILAGRRLNDRMGTYVANKVKQLFEKKSISIIDSKVLIMGLTFKENCPDLRNTNVINVYKKLDEFGCYIDIYDPIADKNQAKLEFGLTLIDYPKENSYDAIILAVAHDEFSKMTSKQIKTFAKDNFVLFDVKYLLEANEVDGRL